MSCDKKIKLYAICGPTASGKSALALEIARRFGGEIISCDSMQIYKKMDIGTAKPTKEEMATVPHHMIDVVEPDAPFSCADYVKMASEVIEDVASRGKLPILCGGTGLYLDALLRGSPFSAESTPDGDLRRELLEFADKNGREALHKRLCEVDPESAEKTHPNNVKRVARALEIYLSTGKKKSELDELSLKAPQKYDATVLALRYNNREILSDRINRRVDVMIEQGLERETRELLESGVFDKNATAAQAIGYKELLGYFKGESTLSECAELLKIATRQYAKRQMTWFRNREYVNFVDADTDEGMRSFEEIVNCAIKLFCLE